MKSETAIYNEKQSKWWKAFFWVIMLSFGITTLTIDGILKHNNH